MRINQCQLGDAVFLTVNLLHWIFSVIVFSGGFWQILNKKCCHIVVGKEVLWQRYFQRLRITHCEVDNFRPDSTVSIDGCTGSRAATCFLCCWHWSQWSWHWCWCCQCCEPPHWSASQPGGAWGAGQSDYPCEGEEDCWSSPVSTRLRTQLEAGTESDQGNTILLHLRIRRDQN